MKYKNTPTVIDGITFDSKAEAERYQELTIMEKTGIISDLVLQPVFCLQESFKKNGKHYRAISYVADFQYKDSDGIKVVEDIKGMTTKVFLLKRKLFEAKYPELELNVIKRVRDGWKNIG